MPRQNFLSRESFVNASEQLTKESILSIPVFASNIKLQSENTMLQKYRFVFEHDDQSEAYFVDVSVLPLNDQYTRISLHATHTSGQAFSDAPEMALALHDFESAIMAALHGDSSLYQPSSSLPKKSKNFLRSIVTIVASISLLVLKKKLS